MDKKQYLQSGNCLFYPIDDRMNKFSILYQLDQSGVDIIAGVVDVISYNSSPMMHFSVYTLPHRTEGYMILPDNREETIFQYLEKIVPVVGTPTVPTMLR